MAAMRDVSATETAIIYGLEPVWGAGFAWFLLGERWGAAGWVGASLVLDDAKLSTTFKVIGGDITTEFKNFKFIVQATPKGEGSCLVHWTLEYEKLNENVPDPRTLLELLIHISKDIEEHHLT